MEPKESKAMGTKHGSLCQDIKNASNPSCLGLSDFVESNLEGELCLALRLSPDDIGEYETHHQDDTEGYDVPCNTTSLHCQYTEYQDQQSCRRTFVCCHVC